MTAPARILVVEDDFAIREALAEVLLHLGYEVRCAANGAEALDQLAAGEAPPSLIVLDLMMPVMDGWAFRTAQRSDPRLAGIPVLVLSACHAREVGTPELGVDAYLAKPFELDRFVAEVHRLC